MSRWSEARTIVEKRAAIASALSEAGTVTGAAQVLGIDRKHLHRVMRGLSDTAPPEPPALVRTAVDLPRPWLDWLEQEALRRKQRGEIHRQAKSPVVVEALELLRMKLEAQPKPKVVKAKEGRP